ncbi:DinB family protein [Sutcliffiella horikoshii]|uniref:DinB family protein n=1 Tax=Sutcliffiella horikoshii TaxID=79883 RepID=UPI00203E5F3A|nr:DinB family protein [Sutcliffiella horikoshii]MCM3617753.1 DinB family protein [Sutcliffiella horikoshii]
MYYEQTYKAREELLELLKGVSEEQLHQKHDSLWTVSQNVEHLYLIENKITNGLRKAIEVKNEVDEKDLPLEKMLANRTYKVEAPEDITPSEHPYTKAELVDLLEQSRANLNMFIQEVDDIALHKYGFNHRWIGDLSSQQWVQLIGFHERRHLAQINETLNHTVQ